MPNSEIGFTFAPGSQGINPSGSGARPSGPQSAVEIRHLQLPNRFVPGQIAPQALLQSAGGAGMPEAAIFQRLMQMFAPQSQQPGVPALQRRPQFPTGAGDFHTGAGPSMSSPGNFNTSAPSSPGGGSAPPLFKFAHDDGLETPSRPSAPTSAPEDLFSPAGPPVSALDLNPLGRAKYEGFSF